MVLVFLEGLLTLSYVYMHEEDKTFELIESRKPRGNADDPFGLKSLFSCRNIADKFLA